MESFSMLLAFCVGNSPVTGEFPSQRPVTWGFDVFFDLRLKNSWVNNHEAGVLRHYHAQYDVTVMVHSNVLFDDRITNVFLQQLFVLHWRESSK